MLALQTGYRPSWPVPGISHYTALPRLALLKDSIEINQAEDSGTGFLPRFVYEMRERKVRSSLLRRSVETYGTQLAVAFVNVLISAVVARILGPEGRGKYAVAVAIGAIGVQLGNIGLHASNSYFVAKDRALLPVLVTNSLFASFVIGGAGAGFVWFFFHLWPRLAPVHGRLLVLGLAWVPLGLAYLLALNLLMGIEEVNAYNRIELLNKSFAVILILGLIGIRFVTSESVLTALILALFASFLLAFRKLRQFFSRSAPPSIDLFRQNFVLGWKAYLVAFFGFLVIRVDLLMVDYLLGSVQAGYYSVAATLADYILLLPAAVGSVLFPRLCSTQENREKRMVTQQAAWVTAIGLLAMTTVVGLSAKLILGILFGHSFLPAASALAWLMPGVFFLGLETVIVQYLNSLGFPVSLVLLWGASALLNVGINLWAIPQCGIAGAAAASSFSYLLAFLVILWMAQRRTAVEA